MTLRIRGGQVLSGHIVPSGNKNFIVPILPATLLFDKPVTFTNVPDITDVDRLIAILTNMGSKITWDKANQSITVDNSAVRFDDITLKDAGYSKGIRGTTLFWGPMLARFKRAESSEQPAGCTLGARPIDAHFQAVIDLGVQLKAPLLEVMYTTEMTGSKAAVQVALEGIETRHWGVLEDDNVQGTHVGDPASAAAIVAQAVPAPPSLLRVTS